MLFYTKKHKMTREIAQNLATNAFIHLTQDPQLIEKFMDYNGLQPKDMRAFTQNPAFFTGVLHFYLNHETALITCAQHTELAPEDFQIAFDLLTTN